VYIKNSQKRGVILFGLAILAAIAAWQFYLFAAFRGADGIVDVQGGTVHLWVAIGVAVITCVGAFFLISSFRRYDRRNEMHITSQERR
jgi:Kef-type K+ transport system membrane component KefB